ncbi:MAG: MATE family efflux transporter [Gammaproteobacteria bacterium]|nr:MATE family efflux transporter [Gammaproteobacteria bacterium]
MIISSVSVPLLGIVDTAVMGHLEDPAYLGATAAGATIFTMLFMGFNFLRMGTTGITAQQFGAGDNVALRTAFGQPLIVASLLALLILLLQQPAIEIALYLLAPGTEVAVLTKTYFSIRAWSAPASLINFVIIGWLIGMQNARGPLVIMLCINLGNIGLDLLFVLGLGMTVDGVALATVIAEGFGLLVGSLFIRAELKKHPGHWDMLTLTRLAAYRRVFAVNGNLFFRTMALMFVFAFITAQGARMGTLILATNAILMNFQLFLSYALDGIAYAAEALVGKAVGGRDTNGLRTAVKRTLNWSLLFAVLFGLVYFIAGNLIINMLTSIDDLRTSAAAYLPWLIISPLISVWSFLYDGVYVGATRSREMMIVMVGSVLFIFLPTWYLFEAWGNHALWLAFTLFMLVRGCSMHLWFRYMIRTDTLILRGSE